MNTGQRTVAGMLAVTAVMLGLNLIVRGSPTAVAGGLNAAGPVLPTAVAMAVVDVGTGNFRMFRTWSDGQVDTTFVSFSGPCPESVDGPCVVLAGSCAGDADRDGIVGVPDLLTTLAAWGPCQ